MDLDVDINDNNKIALYDIDIQDKVKLYFKKQRLTCR